MTARGLLAGVVLVVLILVLIILVLVVVLVLVIVLIVVLHGTNLLSGVLLCPVVLPRNAENMQRRKSSALFCTDPRVAKRFRAHGLQFSRTAAQISRAAAQKVLDNGRAAW